MIRRGLTPVVVLAVLAGGALPTTASARTPSGALWSLEPLDGQAGQDEQAEAPSRVGILPVAVQGELPPSAAAEMRTIIVSNLSAEDVEVIDPAQIDGALAGACEDAECRARLAAQVGADYLVAARIEGDEDEFSTTVILIEGQTGEEVAPFAGECTICGFVEVRDLVRMRALDARAEVIRRARVDVTAPVVEPSAAPVVDQPRSTLVPAGWSLVGAGAAAVVGGVVLLALHKRSAGCLDNPRGGDCVPLRYTTAPAGGAVLGAGVLAGVAGVVMLVLDRKAQHKRRSQLSLTPRGASWRLRF